MMDFQTDGSPMVDWHASDGGRAASGRDETGAGDCVVRAFAHLTYREGDDRGRHYDTCYRLMAQMNETFYGERDACNGIQNPVWIKVFESVGIKQVSEDLMTITDAYYEHGDCIVDTDEHLSCVRDGSLLDSFDCRKDGQDDTRSDGVWCFTTPGLFPYPA